MAPALGWAEPAREPVVDYRFYVYPDPAGTAEQGVANVTAATRLALRALEELSLNIWEGPADSVGIGPVTRFFEWFAALAPAAVFGSVVSHEVFGHGARARELGFSPSYQVLPPPPYYVPTEGSYGATYFGERELPTTPDEDLLLTLGGLEAAELEVRDVAFTGFRSDALRQADVLIYSVGRLHLISMLVREESDAYRFYDQLTARYGADESAVRQELTTAALLGLIDPLLIYGWYTSIARFLIQGERVHEYPALHLGEAVRLSASYRPLPVPWGVEHQLEAMLGGEHGNAATRVRIGNGIEQGSVAASLEVRDLPVAERLSLGARVEVWNQPPLMLARDLDGLAGGQPTVGVLGVGSLAGRASLVGGAAEVTGEYRLERWLWGLTVGGKSEGLQVGQVLAADAYASAFAGLRL